jgi:hypothetical protein
MLQSVREYYAYTHARPNTTDAGGVFYIGKGYGKRAFDLSHSDQRNIWHKRVVAKHGKENILINTIPCSSEKIALELEVGLIKCLRRMGVKLVNNTNGGEGASGARWSKEMKKARAAQSRLMHADAAFKEKHSKRMQELATTPEWKKANGDATRRNWQNPQYRATKEAQSQAMWDDPEKRAKIVAAQTEAQRRPEVNAKMRASVKAAWQREDLKEGQRKNITGRIWVNADGRYLRIWPAELPSYEALGWRKGRR